MRVIKRLPLQEFWETWPQARAPLMEWYRLATKARWRSFAHVKASLGQTDQTKVRSGNSVVIFDVGGNKFRLIARISYEKQKLYVLRILTHKEYGKNLWKAQL